MSLQHFHPMPHAYTEDQLVEQPATIGKAEGTMLKAEVLPPEAITAGIFSFSPGFTR